MGHRRKRQDKYTLPGILNAAASFTESPVFSLLYWVKYDHFTINWMSVSIHILEECYYQDCNNKIMITSTLVVKISFPTTDNSPSQDCPYLDDNHKIKIYPKVQTIYRIT